MTIIVLDGQGGGIGRAIISALLPLLPQGAQLLCVGTNAMAASVGSSRATRILVPTERCGTHVAGAHGVSMQALVEDAARQAAAMAAGA